MCDALSTGIAAFETELGGVLLANMLAAWLDSAPDMFASTEALDELQDHRTSSEQTRLCVCAPVDDGASPAPSGEHRASVCSTSEGAGLGLERSGDPYSGPGSGRIGSTDGGTGGLQNLGH